MTSSAHGSASPWRTDAWPAEGDPQTDEFDDSEEYDLLAQEPPGGVDVAVDAAIDDGWEPAAQEVADPAGRWDSLDQPASEGLTGRALILVSALAAAGCVILNLALTGGRMTFFFDLCFVVICLVSAMAVRRQDLFTAGVLPPLLFAGVIAAVTLTAPDAFESAAGVNRVFLTGLASHAAGLVGGYAVALLAVAARMSSDKPGR